jgi:uncharacterized membrane protein YdfJ with MMPL/SSD domain
MTALALTRTRPTAVKGSAAALLRSEARLFLREPAALFWILAFPTLLLCVLGAIPAFRKPSADLDGLRIVDLYVPIAVLLAVIVAGIQSMPPVLTGYRPCKGRSTSGPNVPASPPGSPSPAPRSLCTTRSPPPCCGSPRKP